MTRTTEDLYSTSGTELITVSADFAGGGAAFSITSVRACPNWCTCWHVQHRVSLHQLSLSLCNSSALGTVGWFHGGRGYGCHVVPLTEQVFLGPLALVPCKVALSAPANLECY